MMVYIHRDREELYRLWITLLLEVWQRSKNISLLDELYITGEQPEKASQEVVYISSIHMMLKRLVATAA